MPPSHDQQNARLTVRIDPMMRPLIPDYLDRRRDDLEAIAKALQVGDFAVIETLGHRMKGSGGSLGFDPLTEIGAQMEVAAAQQDKASIDAGLGHLRTYLDAVDVVYE